jgi:hypothetical protein
MDTKDIKELTICLLPRKEITNEITATQKYSDAGLHIRLIEKDDII